jgi:hypothetical protein
LYRVIPENGDLERIRPSELESMIEMAESFLSVLSAGTYKRKE